MIRKTLYISLISLPLALQASTIWSTAFEAPTYATGEVNGQDGWAYSPSATRLQSEFVAIRDTSTIGALTLNERNLFLDANRTAPSNSRRMDQAAVVTLPVSLNSPLNYMSFRVAMGNSGSNDNSEVFFSFADATNFWGGTFVALKMQSQTSGNGVNILEIYGAGTGNATANPNPVLAQETAYWVTLGTVVSGGVITEVNGWLDAQLIDGVPQGAADVSLPLTASLSPNSTLQVRGQNQPTAITDIVVAAVPEPATYAALVGILALGMVLHRRRK